VTTDIYESNLDIIVIIMFIYLFIHSFICFVHLIEQRGVIAQQDIEHVRNCKTENKAEMVNKQTKYLHFKV
jgi:hypothetical protein